MNYKKEAVNSVVDLFIGENSVSYYFSISGQLGYSYGIGNGISLSNDDILENVRYVQAYNKLDSTDNLDELNFDIQFGYNQADKIYVYLRTIFELNKHYGFTKFVIVVLNKLQSNHVYEFIENSKTNFNELYDNLYFDYFIYDSSNLEDVRDFALNSNLQIMILNMNNFNSKNNVIYKEMDKFNGLKPIEFIAKTNPFVIYDKSQNQISNNCEDAISNLNPICTLNYFSKSQNINNLIYKFEESNLIENQKTDLKLKEVKDAVIISPNSILKEMDSVLDEIRKGHSRKEAAQITGVPLKRIVNWIIEGRNHYDENKTYFYNELIKIEQNKNNNLLYCRICDKTYENKEYKYCPICSAKLMDISEILSIVTDAVKFYNKIYMHCSNCNKRFQEDFKFCPYCGKSLKKQSVFEIDLKNFVVRAKWNNNLISESFINIYNRSRIMSDPPEIDFFRAFNVKDEWDLRLKNDSINLSKKPSNLTFNQVKELESLVNLHRYMGYELNDNCKFMDVELIKKTYSKEFGEFYKSGMPFKILLEIFRKNGIIKDFILVKKGKYELFYVLDISIKSRYGD